MTIIRAKISELSLALAQRGNRGHCAIAHSLAMEHPNYRYIKVDRDQIRFSDVDTRLRHVYRTPRKEQRFIDEWDAGGTPTLDEVVLTPKDKVETMVMKARPPRTVATGLKPVKPPREPGSRTYRSLARAGR
jgi:hypothetical protein